MHGTQSGGSVAGSRTAVPVAIEQPVLMAQAIALEKALGELSNQLTGIEAAAERLKSEPQDSNAGHAGNQVQPEARSLENRLGAALLTLNALRARAGQVLERFDRAV